MEVGHHTDEDDVGSTTENSILVREGVSTFFEAYYYTRYKMECVANHETLQEGIIQTSRRRARRLGVS